MNRYSPKIYDEICIYYQSDFRSRVERTLFHAKWNLPKAAKHCGFTLREMKMTFHEFLKYNPVNEDYQ